MSGKDEKPATPGGEASEQPQKTKAELKAERRAVQVCGCFCLVLFCFFCIVYFLSKDNEENFNEEKFLLKFVF